MRLLERVFVSSSCVNELLWRFATSLQCFIRKRYQRAGDEKNSRETAQSVMAVTCSSKMITSCVPFCITMPWNAWIINQAYLRTNNCGGGNIHRDFDLECFLISLWLL